MPAAENSLKKESLLDRWRSLQQEVRTDSLGLPTERKQGPIPLSLDQQRLWLLQHLHPQSPFYNYAELYKLNGVLQEEHLVDSIQVIVDRHEILRTTFHMDGTEVEQKIHERVELPVIRHDLSNLQSSQLQQAVSKVVLDASRDVFELDRAPLIRLTLIRLTDDLHWAVLNIHHIIFDKWSMKIIREELATVYQALCKGTPISLPKLQFQYADYAHWQRSKEVKKEHLEYWQQKLARPLPMLAIPTDHLRKGKPTFNGAICQQLLSSDLSTELKTLAVENGTTLFVVLLAAYKTLLLRYTGQNDLLVGTPFTNRDKEEFQSVIGFFDETLVLRSKVNDEDNFLDLLRNVKKTVLEALEHKETSYESLVKALKPERYVSVNPLFQTMMIYHELVPGPSLGPDLSFEHEPFDFGVAKFDLTLFVGDDNNQLKLAMEFADDIFERSTIERMQRHLKSILEAVVQDSTQLLTNVPLLSDEEQSDLLVSPSQKDLPFPNILGIHELFEKKAEENPNEDAVVFNGQKLSYKELDIRANNIATHLHKLGIGANEIVALCVENSFEMIAGILGILKVGAAYLPIDPDAPWARVYTTLQDAEVKSILTSQNDHVSNFSANQFDVITFASISIKSVQKPWGISLERDSVAYLLYTSGTTGKPKGIQISHSNLIASIAARYEFYPKQPECFLLMSSYTFDSSVAGIFWTLTTGGTLIIPEKKTEQDLARLGTLISDNNVSHTLLLPSLYQVMLENMSKVELESLTTVIVAGEACPQKLCTQHFETLPDTRFYNEYGPTEATVWCIAHEIIPGDSVGNIPIGKPIPYASAYVLDKNLNLVPSGVIGELYIGGSGVSKGYFNNPELTAERFVRDIFEKSTLDRLYKTGDFVSRRPDGVLMYHGRKDDQVKIRGFRIELNEIQELLKQHLSINDAVVLASSAVKFDNADITEAKQLEQLLEQADQFDVEQLLDSIELLSETEVVHLLDELNKNNKTT